MKKRRNDSEYREFVNAHRSLIYGMLLGDSCITHVSNSYYMVTTHGAVQEDYLRYKQRLLAPISRSVTFQRRAGYTGGGCYYMATKCHQVWTELRAFFYDEQQNPPYKKINGQILDALGDEGVAIWFMDDGSLSHRREKKSGSLYETFTLATHSWSRDDVETIRSWFLQRYDAEGVVSPQKDKRNGKTYWRMTFGRCAFERILKRVAPYVIGSMEYKFRLLSPHRTQENPDFGSVVRMNMRSDLHGDMQSQAEMSDRLREVESGCFPT